AVRSRSIAPSSSPAEARRPIARAGGRPPALSVMAAAELATTSDLAPPSPSVSRPNMRLRTPHLVVALALLTFAIALGVAALIDPARFTPDPESVSLQIG